MLTIGEIYRTEIIDMGQNGEGIGKINGIAVFIRGAVIGDICDVEITQMKKNLAFGRVAGIVQPSEYRIEPICPFSVDCGGCSLAPVSYEGQLRLKEKQVRDNLKRIGGIEEPLIHGILGMDQPYYYRNNGQFPIGGSPEEPAVGFFRAKSHEVVDCPDCILQPAPAVVVAEVMRQYISETGISVYNEKTGKGTLRHVIVRNAEGTGEVMVILVINQGRLPEQEALILWLNDAIDSLNDEGDDAVDAVVGAGSVSNNSVEETAEDGIAYSDGVDEDVQGCDRSDVVWKLRSVVLNINRGKSSSVLGDKNIFLYGQERITDHFEDLDFLISPRSFYQVNTKQMLELYRKVKEYAGLTGTETVFDLYCGVGTISLYLAKYAKQVIGIEVVNDAVLDANRNAIKNGTVNAVFTCGKAEYVLPEMVEKGTCADVAVLDPPRAGCDKKLLDAVAAAGVQRIVYVSCNPSTLARDVKYLKEIGYVFVQAQPVDLFPWTVHVECVCLLTRNK